MAETYRKPHAIMIALPYQGHITPFVNLAIKVASKGLVITFVHLEHIHHTLFGNENQPDLFSAALQSGLDIRYTTISDGFPLEFDRIRYADEYWESMILNFPALVDEFVARMIRSDPFSDHFVIADTFCTWPGTVAKKHNLVNVSFWTEPALVFSLAYHMDLLQENGHFPCKDNLEELINYLPGVESISTKDLMPYLKESENETTVRKLVQKVFGEVKNADFILHNAVQELESNTLSSLNKYQPNYAIGPINFSKNLGQDTVTKSLRVESDCTPWLKSKQPGSVLYISFGSLVQISEQVIEEIAYGLLLSQVNFIWVVRSDTVSYTDANVLPSEFEEETKDKGLIVPWCDQIAVLSDPAVGGFLTHCGWNSVLESVWCNVPMICYPLTYDQPTNRKLAVEDWKIGISLCDGTSIDRNGIARKIKTLMSGPSSEGFKQGVKKVNKILKDALGADGSSERNFDLFVSDLKAKLNCF